MSSQKYFEDWRSSSSRLLGLYSLLFILWCGVLMGSMYWRVTRYLERMTDQSLLQRSHLFLKLSSQDLTQALIENERYDVRGIDNYGLFAPDGKLLGGRVQIRPPKLPVDGRVHFMDCHRLGEFDAGPGSRCAGLATRTSDGRTLIITRNNSTLVAVPSIILDALVWGVSLTIVPGLLGWHLLRRRPLRRIRAIQAQVERIAAGELIQRLPLSDRRDELDMLASIVNAMLDRIEQLMHEVKSSSDAVAHDLRTPLTRLRAHLYRTHQQTSGDDPHALPLEQALAETDALLGRFRALLRISELEDHRRRSNFLVLDPGSLLQELHGLYTPLAEERAQDLQLRISAELPTLHGDRGLLFEALGNLLDNAIKFSPKGGRIELVAKAEDDSVHISVHDCGSGIPHSEREAVLQRFYRGTRNGSGEGFGLGLSIVSAIAALHGFALSIDSSTMGGACISLHCRCRAPLL